MLIDYDISENADVSSILDQFLIDNTQSDIVIQFLSKYDDQLSKIWRYSDFYKKIFQFDYWKSSDLEVKNWIAAHLNKISVNSAAILCWQICSISSSCSEVEKKEYRRHLNHILKKTRISHPYSKSCESYIRPLDNWIFAHLDAGYTFPDCIAKMPNEIFMRYIPWIFSSLFSTRVYQLDVFDTVDDIKKWHMLKYMHMLSFDDNVRFCSQIYASDLDETIKIECLKIQTSDAKNDTINYKYLLFQDYPEIFSILASTRSFDVIQIEFASRGCQYCLKNILMYYILKGDVKMLIKWWDNCKDEVKEVYDLEFVKTFDKFSDVSKRISLT